MPDTILPRRRLTALQPGEMDLSKAMPEMMIDEMKPQTLAESLQRRIEQEIVEGHLKPGDRLDEEELAARLGASRTPVREALRALASIGLVLIRPRVGASVNRPTVSEIVELFEIVAELEAFAARLASAKADDAQRAAIMTAHEHCLNGVREQSADAYFEANTLFHQAIWDASGNRMLFDQIMQLDRRLSPYRRFITFNPGRTDGALSEHATIAHAIQNRDASTAAAAMRDHVAILSDDVLLLARNLRI